MMNPLLKKIHQELDILDHHIAQCKLPAFEQAALHTLEVADIDFDGRPFVLERRTAKQWQKLREEAGHDGIVLDPYSGFRSYLHQKQLIVCKLANGKPLEIILTETTIPGFSEHHTGCAVDICTASDFRLEQDFEKTKAFAWLTQNGTRFGFRMSYPRENRFGIIFEPWHWFFAE
jgi:D-alanyl-D-alanine carboxypeptidase